MKLPLQLHIQALAAHGEDCSAQRFEWQLSLPGEIPLGILCVSGQLLPLLGYGFQKLSLQSAWIVSHPYGPP